MDQIDVLVSQRPPSSCWNGVPQYIGSQVILEPNGRSWELVHHILTLL